MDMNYMKGGNKGKAKGKGFQGKCYFCDEPGHSKAHCPKLDKIMSEQRAKGGQPQQQYGQQQWSGGYKGYQPQQPFGSKGKGGGKSNFGKGYGQQPWSGGGKGYQQQYQQQYGGKGGKGYQPQSIYGFDFLDGQQGSGYEDYNYQPAFSVTIEEREVPAPPVPEAVRAKHRTRTSTKSCSRICSKVCCARLPKSEVKIGNRFDALDTIEEDEFDISDFPQASTEKANVEIKMPKMPKTQGRNKEKKMHKNFYATDAKVENEINLIMDKLDMEYAETDLGDEVNIFEEEEVEEADSHMLALGEHEQQQYGEGWVKVSGCMDSGAADHVTNRDTVPHVPIRPSPGSKRGQKFISATGSKAANEGEQQLQGYTAQGDEADMIMQITDVKKTLFSVPKICERGNRVIFGRGGGVIHNLATNKLTPFPKVGGIYCMDLWVPKNTSGEGFHRQ
jgi:hypothetical protein